MNRSVEGLRVTPWADWSEWWEVKTMLNNGNVRQANERVNCYLIRRRHAVPVAMITSVNLQYQLENPSQDEYSQRLGLAMAIVRFVNGMTDRLQPRGEGAFAKSVHSLAVELKLPLILVEIRHQASHNSLPRLTALESGARKALQWLDQFYWDAQYQKIRSFVEESPRALKKTFLRDGEFESQSLSTTPSASGTQRSVDIRNAQEKEVDVLSKLKALTNAVAKDTERKKKDKRDEADCPENPVEQWAECGDSEKWKVTPIGVVPGQKQAPRWPADFTNTKCGSDADDSEHLQVLPTELAGVDETDIPETPCEPVRLDSRKLNPSEMAKVHDMTIFYERLLRPTQSCEERG